MSAIPNHWLFIIQHFELKQIADSAGLIEVVQPIVNSRYVQQQHCLHFRQDHYDIWQPILNQRCAALQQQLQQQNVVIYGAGLHTNNQWSLFEQFNVVAIADKNMALWGSTLFDLPIINPALIADYADQVIISSKAFEQAIILELNLLNSALNVYPLYSHTITNTHYWQHIYQQIVQALADNTPEVVLFCPTHPSDSLPLRYWQQLQQQFPQIYWIALWWDYDDEHEQSQYLAFERDCLQWANVVIENSNGSRLSRMQQQQAPYQDHHNSHKVIFHPTAFSPQLFYRHQPSQLLYDIGLFGSKAGARARWIELLQQYFGAQFHHIGGVHYGQAILAIEDYAQAVAASKIIVNTQTYPFRSQCKGKVRETLACGRFLLEEDNPETRLVVPEYAGVVYFSGEDDLIAKVNYYLTHDEEREHIATAGYEWYQQHWASDIWLERLFNQATEQGLW